MLTALRLGSPYLTSGLIEQLTAEPQEDIAATLLTYNTELTLPVAQKLMKVLLTSLLASEPKRLSQGNRPILAIEHALLRYDCATDEELLKLLTGYTYSSLEYLDELISPIIDIRPSLLEKLTLCPAPHNYYPSIAASRFLTPEIAEHLRDYLLAQESLTITPNYETLSNLTDNPNLPPQLRADLCEYYITKEAIAAPDPNSIAPGLSWQGARDLYQRLADSNTQPLTNNWVPTKGSLAEEVEQAISALGDWRYPALFFPKWGKDDTFQKAAEVPDNINVPGVIDPAIDALGPEGWSVFISMLLEWSGSTPDLIEVVKSITDK